MVLHMRRLAAVALTLLCSYANARAAEDDECYVYEDNVEYYASSDNLVELSWTDVEESFSHPNSVVDIRYDGVDWTKPFPEDGEKRSIPATAHLTVARDVPDSSGPGVTTLSSITYSVDPQLMGDDGLPLPMDPTWHVCRYIWISDKPDVMKAVAAGDSGCQFLGEECIADMTQMTEDWGQYYESDGFVCPISVFSPVPPSCFDTFGYARSDGTGFNTTIMDDPEGAKLMAVNEQYQRSWRIGTDFGDPGNQTAHDESDGRTYLLMEVHGPGLALDNWKDLSVYSTSFACLTSRGESTATEEHGSDGSAATDGATGTSQVASSTVSSTNPETSTSGAQRRYGNMPILRWM